MHSNSEKNYIVQSMEHGKKLITEGMPYRNRPSINGIANDLFSSMDLDANTLLEMLVKEDLPIGINQNLLNELIQKLNGARNEPGYNDNFEAPREYSPKKTAREDNQDTVERPLKRQKTNPEVDNLPVETVTAAEPRPKAVRLSPTETQQIQSTLRKEITKCKLNFPGAKERTALNSEKGTSKLTATRKKNGEINVRYTANFTFFK